MRLLMAVASAFSVVATGAELPSDFLSAVSAIVERSPDVKVQQETLSALKSQNIATHLNLLPSLSLTASHQQGASSTGSSLRTGLEATMDVNVFRFGADTAAQNAARSEERAQALNLKATILKVESEGVRVLLLSVQGQKEVQTLRRMVENREQALRIAQTRFKRGLLAAQEVDKVTVDRDNALAELRDAEAALATSSADLKAALGHIAIEGEWPWPSQLSLFSKKLLKFPIEELSQRPDWGAALERKMAAQYKSSQGWGRIFPSLDISLGYGYFDSAGVVVGNTRGPEWRAGVTISVPLFDRLANYGAYRALVHNQNAADWEGEKTKRLAQGEWEAAKENLTVALSTLELRLSTLKTSRKLFSDNQKRFESGLASANELSVDLQRLLDSERSAIRGYTQAHLSFTRLCHSLGKNLTACVSAQ